MSDRIPKNRKILLEDRVTRAEFAIAAICEMLTTTNPHVEIQLTELADTITKGLDEPAALATEGEA